MHNMKNLNEDGHTDKPSAIRKLKVSIENAEAILKALESNDKELMSWWMDKITLANDYLSKAKDFIENPVNENYEADREGYKQYFKDNKFFRKDLIKIEKYSKGAPSFMKRGEIGMATQMLRDIKFQVDNILEEIADEFDMPELVDHVVKEAATPKSNPEYFKGLSKKDKEERERVIKRRSKMDSGDPRAYKGFATDKGEKTKPSKWNAKFKKMYGEMTEDQKKVVHEKLSAKIKKALKNKAKKANAPQGALTTVYNKGLAAWRTGHRPGASQHAWAMARVNSFLAGGPARKVDSAQWNQVKKHRKKK
tara:strand:- start:1787 stop:2710 length:924 start_codon:yes stop_codon:yes gene_type:complete